MTIFEHVLEGCAPVPLAGYLKALGVFRLVAEQKDADARGFWRDERFVLRTRLSKEELIGFFVEEYEPSPIISPWNGRAGFLEGVEGEDEESTRGGAELVRKYEAAAPRFGNLRKAVETYKTVAVIRDLDRARAEAKPLQEKKRKKRPLTEAESDRLKFLEKDIRQIRAHVVGSLRSETTDEAIDWFDACRRAGLDNAPMPLLGSGGLDGSRDFGMNFGEALDSLFDLATGLAKPGLRELVESSLFVVATTGLKRGNAGQYEPGAVGENVTTGFSGQQPFNPLDLVLLLEGTMLFYGAATRRLGSTAAGGASFPFTVKALTAGSGGTAPVDDSGFAEFWAPIWNRPAAFWELKALLTEGRAAIGAETAKDGLQFAVAVRSLGLARGIEEFQRYALLQREPRNPRKATPLGRVRVRESPRASLVADLDRTGWLSKVREAVAGKGAPASLLSLGRQLDETLFHLTEDDSPAAVQEALIAIGEVAFETGRRPKLRESLPQPRLSVAWASAAKDSTPEFALAAALASLDAATEDRGFRLPFRRHLGPLGWPKGRETWDATTEATALAVWSGRSLVRDMTSVLERRLVEAQRRRFHRGGKRDGEVELPLRGWRPASLAAAAAFLAGHTDDERIAALAMGLAWISRFSRPVPMGTERAENAAPVPEDAGDEDAAPVRNTAEGEVSDVEEEEREAPASHAQRPVRADALPFAYAALKPLFDPKGAAAPRPPGNESRRYGNDDTRGRKVVDPLPLIRLLEAGRAGDAVIAAHRIARGAGLAVSFSPSAPASATASARIAAGLLIPISDSAVETVAWRAYPDLTRDKEESDAA